MNPPEEKAWMKKIQTGDQKAFEMLFHKYYGNLCLYATKILNNNEAAEEVVQDFFVKFWGKREQINIDTSIKNYVFRSIRNLCLNHIKHNDVKENYIKNSENDIQSNIDFEEHFIEVDLVQKIEESINSLPEKRREIFRLSREEGLKYREIAEKLNISIKTVEAQMSLAIKNLREKLKDYKHFLMLFFILFKRTN
ncbi:RNA polymerase sigma-70 factor [Maribellus maritimus]|uniref:RNA polymerase sigma-70 factor n=1 Tax=Maribellus maritimus TaxID=2870838 RepID=UPI001EECC0F7|nr:RNA polymerase sigma-70 factor [Maribellus maritimus]MCG6190758.1 RNA polymerase sigma-70 factor [Maribellus maritimus]